MPFPKGRSGNPGGRPKGVRALLCQKYGPQGKKLIEAIHGIAFSDDPKLLHKTRLEALKLLLSYHSGQPPNTVELPDGETGVGPFTFVIKARS